MPCSHPLSFRDRLFSSGRDPDREGSNRVDTSSRQTSETKAAPSSLAILRRTGRDCFSSFGRLGPPFRRVAVMVIPLASPRAASPRPTIQVPGCRALDTVLRPPGWPSSQERLVAFARRLPTPLSLFDEELATALRERAILQGLPNLHQPVAIPTLQAVAPGLTAGSKRTIRARGRGGQRFL